jgi:hypothetical protein
MGNASGNPRQAPPYTLIRLTPSLGQGDIPPVERFSRGKMASRARKASIYEIGIRYLCSAFVDTQETLQPTAKVIEELATAMAIPDFQALTVLEGPAQAARIMFHDPERSIQIFFGSKRIDISRNMVGAVPSDFGDFGVFAKRAGTMLAKAIPVAARVPHRLAAVREGFLPDLPAADMDSICTRLLKLPMSFTNPPPFEWDWRCARRVERNVGRSKETFNEIAAIKRVSGTFQLAGEKPKDFDRIRLDFDINTSPENLNARFDASRLTKFFDKAGTWQEDLACVVLPFLKGQGTPQ